ncbi:flagellar basal body P-ring formation chaperone FlgA [Roseateles sp. BYS180W]|uniref:Flagella basal body P-ring formation protein FlgA n=1 Tax=Roseateles rivi TaxID=3299028 RepID=A0ABW7FUX8_9BURK
MSDRRTPRPQHRSTFAALRRGLLAAGLAALSGAHAQDNTPQAWQQQLQQLAQSSAQQGLPASARLAVEIGALDPRLQLAPCQQVEPFMPPGLRMWGRTRIGLRCLQGPKRWSVTLPLQVRVWAQAWVAAQPLPMGTALTQDMLKLAEVDIADGTSNAIAAATVPLGRVLQRPLAQGEALRQDDLKRLQWFATGERVNVRTQGPGFTVDTEGQALGPGLDGQDVRVRTDAGRVVQGRAVGQRLVEMP